MNDPWFGSDIPRWLAFLSLLSLLSIPAAQGRWKTGITLVWVAILASAGLLLAGAAAAAVVGQPEHVVRTLTILGLLFGTTFGATLPVIRRSYHEAELRKTVAADL